MNEKKKAVTEKKKSSSKLNTQANTYLKTILRVRASIFLFAKFSNSLF